MTSHTLLKRPRSFIRRSFKPIILALILVLCGCTSIPSTNIASITKLENSLYLTANEVRSSSIKTFDTTKHVWTDEKIETTPITKMINDGEKIYIQAGWENKILYSVMGKDNIDKVGSLFFSEQLSAVDNEFFYAIEAKSIKENWLVTGVRYTKNLKNRLEYHFEDDHNLIVVDSKEDDTYYWHACLDSPSIRANFYPEGKLVLLAKTKQTGTVERFLIETDSNRLNDIRLVDSVDSIWVFSLSNSDFYTRIVKFSKTSKSIVYSKKIATRMIPFQTMELTDHTEYLWSFEFIQGVGLGKVCRLDKDSLEVKTVNLPAEIQYMGKAFYADHDFLWVGAYVNRKKTSPPSGWYIPYVLRISKKDMSYEIFVVEPTLWDGIKTIAGNFVGNIIRPFLSP